MSRLLVPSDCERCWRIRYRTCSRENVGEPYIIASNQWGIPDTARLFLNYSVKIEANGTSGPLPAGTKVSEFKRDWFYDDARYGEYSESTYVSPTAFVQGSVANPTKYQPSIEFGTNYIRKTFLAFYGLPGYADWLRGSGVELWSNEWGSAQMLEVFSRDASNSSSRFCSTAYEGDSIPWAPCGEVIFSSGRPVVYAGQVYRGSWTIRVATVNAPGEDVKLETWKVEADNVTETCRSIQLISCSDYKPDCSNLLTLQFTSPTEYVGYITIGEACA